MDGQELRLFEAGVRRAVQHHEGSALDEALNALGWRDALADDPRAVAIVFAAQGERGVSSSALDDVVCAGLGVLPDPQLAVVLPSLDRSNDVAATAPAPHLVVDGIGTGRSRQAGHALVAVGTAADPYVVRLPISQLVIRPVAGIDPTGEWATVTGDLPDDAGDRIDADWHAGVAHGRLALATELVAGARAMLRLARDHAVTRMQAGRPISSFQAVRHRLADGLVAVESAEAAVAAGWEEPTSYRAAMAKAIAGRNARTVARHAQQVLGGMGFTSEHGFHRLLKRTMTLDQVLGASSRLSADIGRQAIEARRVPPLLEL